MKKFAIFLLFFTPLFASAQVSITEIMYDLSGSDTGREWVEILNGSGASVDFSTWRLREVETNHTLALFSGQQIVSSGGYAIIADNPEKFLLDWPNFQGILFDSSFSLSNTGETVVLKNTALEDVDTVSYASGTGAAGDGNSLQKENNIWVSKIPTPGAANSGESAQIVSELTEAAPTTKQGESGVYVSSPTQTIVVDAGAPKRVAVTGADMVFDGVVYGLEGEIISNARFLWNFGDGTTKDGKRVSHAYRYAGEYIVLLEGSSGGYSSSDRIIITVVPADIFIDSIGIAEDFYISLTNNTAHEINVGGWELYSGDVFFRIPDNTHIASKKKLRFAPETTGLLHNARVALAYPSGAIASEYGKPAVTPVIPSAPPIVPAVISEGARENKSVAATSQKNEIQTDMSEAEYSEESAALAAPAYARDGGRGILPWFTAAIGLIFIALAALFFLFRQVGEKEPSDVSADDFTILEDKR